MAQTSQVSDSDAKKILEGQLRECYGRTVYSHKTHEKCSDILQERLSNIKLWQIILSAITTGSFISTFLGAGNVGTAIGVVISTTLLVLNAYTKNNDLGELAQKHKQAANGIWLIREKYLSMLTDLAINRRSLEEILQERDVLLEGLHAAYTGSPSTNFDAYKKAQEALQLNEDLSFTDKEIDSFLPQELRRTS